MSSPVEERKTFVDEKKKKDEVSPTSDDGTYVTEPNDPGSHLRVDTAIADEDVTPPMSTPSARREQATRLEDDLLLLQAERVVSRSTQNETEGGDRNSISRTRSRRSEAVDEFDEATNPLHEKAAVYTPPESPNTKLSAFVKRLHQSSFIVRYLTYIVPLVLLLLIPLLLGALRFPNTSVGGVELMWFAIWLEIVWLTLWAGRVSASTGHRERLQLMLTCSLYERLSSGVFLQSSVCWLVYSPTMRRNGVTWPSSWKSTLPCSSGGLRWRFHSCPP